MCVLCREREKETETDRKRESDRDRDTERERLGLFSLFTFSLARWLWTKRTSSGTAAGDRRDPCNAVCPCYCRTSLWSPCVNGTHERGGLPASMDHS